MTEYKNYRIKEADICDCKHVRGYHAGTHFGLTLTFMAIIIFSYMPLKYIGNSMKIDDNIISLIWAAILGIGMFWILFKFDKGCSGCTCKKFKWSGKNEDD